MDPQPFPPQRQKRSAQNFRQMDEPPELKLEGIAGNNWKCKLPIAIAVDWRNSRIEHQQGVFTYHGTRSEPLNKLVPDW